MLTGSEIREKFLRFFESKGHRRVHSSSLVPANDPTLLFTNAGMNQFKDVFLGLEKRDYARATSSQKCVRAGGKHNDLENVGFTKRHHTFFEMLGNFSFGDYFKREAIQYAWELVTSKEWFNIDTRKLYCTIFQGEQGIPRDDEAEKYWIEVGMPKDRIFGLDMKDNFWSMADTGPCGPCSEIHYDMGAEASEQGHTDCKFPCDCGRYVEFWNLVFMQFDRDSTGTYNPLPKPSVDTGMGLERVSTILQGVISNYDTDLFTPLIGAAAKYCNTQQARLAGIDVTSPRYAASLRIIADHARATTFLIADDVLPSNEGRGYVLRKIMRRAMRHAKLLHGDDYVLSNMATSVADQMSGGPYEEDRSKFPYPELRRSLDHIRRVIRSEEIRFTHTVAVGLQKLEELLDQGLQAAEIHSQAAPFLPKGSGWLSGRDAFKLYDTFGLPVDFIVEASRDRGVQVNLPEFEQAMLEQRERARASWRATAKAMARPEFREMPPTIFEGYHSLESGPSMIRGIFKLDAPPVLELNQGEEGEVLLDRTPFYADSGGQVGDFGWFYDSDRNQVVADVFGCTMPVQGVRLHKVRARKQLRRSDLVIPVVSTETRLATMRNHTATHLLHAGLREVLGKHVKQAGSLVEAARLRFDFSHFTGIADEELQDIEDMINHQVLKDVRVETVEDVPIDVAINEYKAMALFGEKYGERVRVIRIGDFSTELCGGIHTSATGEIGLIKILSEGSVSSGVRRVEAVTGEGSLKHFRKGYQLENAVATLIPQSHKADSPAEALRQELEKKEAEIKKLQKELEQMRMKSAASTVSSAEERVREIRGVKVLAQRVDNLDRNQMRTLVDNLRNKLGSGVVVLGSAQDGKVALIVGVTKDLTGRVQAGKVIKPVAEKVGGSGGGRPDMAEAGGKDPEKLDAALMEAYSAVDSLLA